MGFEGLRFRVVKALGIAFQTKPLLSTRGHLAPEALRFGGWELLRGSWVVISGAISRATMIRTSYNLV